MLRSTGYVWKTLGGIAIAILVGALQLSIDRQAEGELSVEEVTAERLAVVELDESHELLVGSYTLDSDPSEIVHPPLSSRRWTNHRHHPRAFFIAAARSRFHAPVVRSNSGRTLHAFGMANSAAPGLLGPSLRVFACQVQSAKAPSPSVLQCWRC